MNLECPVCLNSLLSPVPADVPCPSPECSPNELCAGCGGNPETANNGNRRKRGARAGPSRLNSTTSVTPCGHIFHSRCLNGWMQETTVGRPTCPTCRHPFVKSRVMPVYLNASAGADDVEANAPNNAYLPLENSADPEEVSAEDVVAIPYEGSNMADLRMRHNTLISDFNELKAKYWELKDEDDFRKAQIMSLEQELQLLQQTVRQRETETGAPIFDAIPTTSGPVRPNRKRGAANSRISPRNAKRGRPIS